MTITDKTEIQRLVTRQVSEPNLTKAAEAGDKQILSITGRSDWTPSEYVYGALQNIGAVYGAYTVLISWDKDEYFEKAKLMLEAYQKAVDDFRKLPLPESSVNPEFGVDVATSDYENPYLNPEKPFFMSQY